MTTIRCRLRPRARSLHPIQLSRHGSVFVAASNSRHPSLRPSRSATKVTDVRPKRATVAEVVVAVDEGVPQLPSVRVGGRLEAQRTQVGKVGAQRRSPVGGRGPDGPGRHVPDLGLPLRRQRQDAMPLQCLQQLHARPDPVIALRRHPVEMLADGLRELVAAVVGKQRHGLLDVRNLPPGQAATGKRGRFQVGDSQCGNDVEIDAIYYATT